jgi:hypothetical protein
MRHFISYTSVCAALALAACGRQSTMDEQMKRDLEAASVGGIELAPTGARTNVVSAIESKQPMVPKVTPTRRAPAPAQTPPPIAPQVTETNTDPIATRPVTRPAISPPPPGGYKSVNEVIRNAPFPIKPATKRP